MSDKFCKDCFSQSCQCKNEENLFDTWLNTETEFTFNEWLVEREKKKDKYRELLKKI